MASNGRVRVPEARPRRPLVEGTSSTEWKWKHQHIGDTSTTDNSTRRMELACTYESLLRWQSQRDEMILSIWNLEDHE